MRPARPWSRALCSRLQRRGQAGFMSIEMVLLTPVLVAAIIIIVAAARFVDARDQVSDAAYAAARAASLSQPGGADTAAQQAASAALAQRGKSCSTLQVHVNTANYTGGGNVRVRIQCVADLSDMVGFGLPGHKTFTGNAVVPIDVHRVI